MSVRATVVIPFFADQRCLDLVLTALELQTLPAAEFEVVVADDGSPHPPVTGPRPYAVRTVRQDDLGARPGTARNLGARVGTGQTLVFLDGDTVPEPAYLAELLAACDGRRLAVGRRLHADLAAFDPPALRSWLTTGAPAPPQLPAPEWLEHGYAVSDDLRDSDLRSYRFVISAVMACPRELFLRVGGFAEELNRYGGEDWELARRCWLAGADLVHARRAVAWHDGPDFAGRPGDVAAVKNAETLRIAGLLTDPALRGRGLLWPYPRFVVRLALPADVPDAVRVACCERLLAAGDVGVWLGTDAPSPVPDPRIQPGLPSAAVLGRCELVVDLAAPVAADPDTLEAWQRIAPARNAQAFARSPRDEARDVAPGPLPPLPVLPEDLQLERWFAR
jgi:GT2 family glycosyltransferase